MSAVQNLINEVSHKLKALETAQALYSRQLSPDFNTFEYINTDELGLSRILAAWWCSKKYAAIRHSRN